MEVDPDAELRPFGYLGLTLARGLNLDVQSQPGSIFRAGLDFATLHDGAFGAEYAWTRPAGGGPTLDGGYAALRGSAPISILGGRTVSGRLQLRGSESGSPDSWEVHAATTLRRSYVSAGFESGLQDRSTLTARAFTPLGSTYGPWLQDLAASLGLGLSSRGGELLELGASFRPTPTASASCTLLFPPWLTATEAWASRATCGSRSATHQ